MRGCCSFLQHPFLWQCIVFGFSGREKDDMQTNARPLFSVSNAEKEQRAAFLFSRAAYNGSMGASLGRTSKACCGAVSFHCFSEEFVDWSFIAAHIPDYLGGAWITLRFGLYGVFCSLALGLFCCLARYFRVPVLRQAAACYIELARNTPLLVQLFFIYFGLPKAGIRIPAEICGFVGLGLLGGSYMAEGFRSGLDAVSPAQTESALALGMTETQLFFYVILPEAFSLSAPAIVANVIFLLKETSVFSAISLMDLMFTAKDLIGLYYNTTEALFLLVVFYTVMLLPVSMLGSLLEKKVRYKMFGA